MSARPTRVLFNALHAKTGGGVTYLKAILPRLAKRKDLKIHLLIHANQSHLLPPLDPGICLHKVNFPDGFLKRLIWEQLALPFYAWVLAEVTFSPANFGPLLAPRPVILLRNALDVEFHEARPGKRLYWKALRLMTWLSLLRAPIAAAVSDYARRKLGFGFQDKVAVIHHGTETDLFTKAGGARQDFLLAVGDITVQKNYVSLIEALAELPMIKLRIAGHAVDGGHAAELERLVRHLGMTDRVEFLGRVEPERLALLYMGCRAFVFPSTVETFGNPLVEAMASGCPILCANAAAMPEILGDAGLYCPPLDIDCWRRELGRLWHDETLRNHLSAAASKRAARFDWEISAARLAELLKAAAAKPASGWLVASAWIWIAGIFAAYILQYRPLARPILKALGWH